MIISDKLLNELVSLEENIQSIIDNNKNINNLQLEAFLRNLEKRRYNILSQIKLYNKTIEYKKFIYENISIIYCISNSFILMFRFTNIFIFVNDSFHSNTKRL